MDLLYQKAIKGKDQVITLCNCVVLYWYEKIYRIIYIIWNILKEDAFRSNTQYISSSRHKIQVGGDSCISKTIISTDNSVIITF